MRRRHFPLAPRLLAAVGTLPVPLIMSGLGNSMQAPYCPISCDIHDQLLELATLRQLCLLTISSRDKVELVRGIIVDVYSAQGGEYVKLKEGGTYRLDRILALNGRRVGRS